MSRGNYNYVYNSYNIGDIELVNGTNIASSGGIVGHSDTGNLVIENCYNIGVLKSSRNIGAIVGSGSKTLKNCFYLENLQEGYGNISENNATSINEQQLKGDKDINGKVLVDILNEYVDDLKEKEGIQLKKWVHSSDGYPIFE